MPSDSHRRISLSDRPARCRSCGPAVIVMTKRLRDRMGMMTPTEFKALETKADKVKVDLLAMFLEHAAVAMSTMRKLVAAPRHADKQWRSELYAEAHNLKGLGGSFDYDLVTLVADSL